MEEIINLLSYTFMQRAVLCGIAISFSAALIGVILTLKNLRRCTNLKKENLMKLRSI